MTSCVEQSSAQSESNSYQISVVFRRSFLSSSEWTVGSRHSDETASEGVQRGSEDEIWPATGAVWNRHSHLRDEASPLKGKDSISELASLWKKMILRQSRAWDEIHWWHEEILDAKNKRESPLTLTEG